MQGQRCNIAQAEGAAQVVATECASSLTTHAKEITFLSLHLCHHALPKTARQKRLLQLKCVWHNESNCLEGVGTCIKRPLQLPEKHR
jgi:hypothetical protein